MTIEIPETRFARSGDAHIAYQVVGDGPVDLLLLYGMFMPMESLTDEGPVEWLLHRLTAFSRVILFDRRGIGLSYVANAASLLR